jgi:hypothetical protein
MSVMMAIGNTPLVELTNLNGKRPRVRILAKAAPSWQSCPTAATATSAPPSSAPSAPSARPSPPRRLIHYGTLAVPGLPGPFPPFWITRLPLTLDPDRALWRSGAFRGLPTILDQLCATHLIHFGLFRHMSCRTWHLQSVTVCGRLLLPAKHAKRRETEAPTTEIPRPGQRTTDHGPRTASFGRPRAPKTENRTPFLFPPRITRMGADEDWPLRRRKGGAILLA